MTIRRWEEVNFFHKWHKRPPRGRPGCVLDAGCAADPVRPEHGIHLSKRVKHRPDTGRAARRPSFDKQRGRALPESRASPARTAPRACRRPRGGRTTTTGSSSGAPPPAPPRITGRSTMRLTPTMATSGWLMTGVLTMPPSAPRLVIVIVEPLSSSRVALPLRAASASAGDLARRRPTGPAPRRGAAPAPSGRCRSAWRCPGAPRRGA